MLAARPAPNRGGGSVERRVDALLARMTLREKLAQLEIVAGSQATDAAVRAGAGVVYGVADPARIGHLQRVAVRDTRLHIPLLFAFDTLHGFRTVFPIPLAEASSLDPAVARADAAIAARESAAVGIKQIYAPMVDVSHEPRWGRIAEGAGEDPYLGSVLAATRVRAAQGSDYGAPDKVVTSPKHFVAYGQPEGGREYGTVDVSEQRLRNFYLPPFAAAIAAGAGTVMCSFDAIGGVPGCADRYTESDVLEREWGFDGFVESDYRAVPKLRACPPRGPASGPCGHGVAADGAAAARAALDAGTDMEMASTEYADFGPRLVAAGAVPIRRIDDAVRRVLRVKLRAGLFERPYADLARAPGATMRPADVRAARWAAARSMVLLKDSGGALPLRPGLRSVAVVGPLADDRDDPLGPWAGIGRDADVVTVREGIRRALPHAIVRYAPGCDVACASPAGFGAAVAAARRAQATVVVVGESRAMSGEAASRADIGLPGRQQALVDAIARSGRPFVVVLMNGRPLTIGPLAATAPAILEAWFGGIETGDAIADVLLGKVNPGGKLPVTFPRSVGQIPIYYDHEPTGAPSAPLYPFGYGLSYTSFRVSDLRLSAHAMAPHGSVTASVRVTDTGRRGGDDVVQLYVHDPVASISQPVRRLRGFRRVALAPGRSATVRFRLGRADVGFYDGAGRFVVEPGEIDVYAGDGSTAALRASFTVR